MAVQVRAAAKINLWLEVIAKRSDGFHELSSLMLPVSIFDLLELELTTRGVSLECTSPHVPGDERNLAWRAARAFLDASAWETGVHIKLVKEIPVAAGLGGGSADAGAVLAALNRLCPRPLGHDQLVELARTIGADVAFFLYQHPALAGGIGERLQEIRGLPSYPVVLIKPPFSISTRWVYRSLKLTRGHSRIRIDTLLSRPWQPAQVMENDLESVTLPTYPLVGRLKRWLSDQGALGALMSGSGPTVFGVFREPDQAREVALLAAEKWGSCWVASADTDVPPSLAASRSVE